MGYKTLTVSLCCLLLSWRVANHYFMKSRSSRPPLYNDDYSEYFDPTKVLLPSSEAEIIEIVERAAELHQNVRVLGSGHSRNALAVSKDIIMSLENFKGAVSLDASTQEVTFRGGTTLAEIIEYLDENGLAVGTLPTILEQTIAGAISTATHGCRATYGNLAALVTKLKLVTSEGKSIILSSKDTNTDLFRAAQASLGLLGVITEVTLQCEPSFILEETFRKTSLADCLANLTQYAFSAEHVKLWMEMYTKTCDIYSSERTNKPERMNTMLWRNLKMRLWEPFLWLASWAPSDFIPAIVGKSMVNLGVFYPEYTQVGKSFEILTAPLYVPTNKQLELAVDMKDCVSALKMLEGQMDTWRPPSIFYEVRFVKGDDVWLSADYGRDSCHITLIIYNPSEEMEKGYFNTVYDELQVMGFKPRPHFGKFFNLTADELTNIYPKYIDFNRVRAELDPSDTFLNEMLADMF